MEMNEVMQTFLHILNHADSLTTMTSFETRLANALTDVGFHITDANAVAGRLAFIWYMSERDVADTAIYGMAYLNGFVTAIRLRGDQE